MGSFTGRNLVVHAEVEAGTVREGVVVVDFDLAQVFAEQETVQERAWQDWAFFRNAFLVWRRMIEFVLVERRSFTLAGIAQGINYHFALRVIAAVIESSIAGQIDIPFKLRNTQYRE